MKFLFSGAIDPVLQRSLFNQGHTSVHNPKLDWYNYYTQNRSPDEWADACAAAIKAQKPDVFVLCKGALLKDGNPWHVPVKFLWWAKKQVKCMVFISFDCPASTPLYIQYGLLPPFDLFGTTCVGISKLFSLKMPKRLKVFEFWLGFNQEYGKNIPIKDKYKCDLAITGTPYYKPWARPHYQGGFGFPRRDLVRVLQKKSPGIDIALYGPKTWLDIDQGGDPAFKKIYKGWVPSHNIHFVHKAAKVCLGTQLVQGYRYESGRCVWVGGAGGFMLHEDRPGLRDTFGGSVMWFNPGDVNHAHKQLKLALADDKMREKMSCGLHRLVWNGHTWYHRASTLIQETETFIKNAGR